MDLRPHRNRGRCVESGRPGGARWLLVLLVAGSDVSAESTDTNVVTASADAFGVSIGVETLGVYNQGQVRGFDPLGAGNGRIEGLYFDVHGTVWPYGPLPARLVEDTRIRVGPAAAGFPFPSPTGIVDFTLRSPLGAAGLSSTIYAGPFDTRNVDLDAHAPLAGGHCGVGGGISRRSDEFAPAATQYSTDVALLGSCQAAGGSGATFFYGRTTETQQAIYPIIYLTTAPIPDAVESRNFGPTWAHGTTVLTDYGGLFKLDMPAHWTLRAGVFRSIYDQPNSGSDLLYDPNAAGIAQNQYVSYPDQFTGSTSGELRATHSTTSGPRQYELILTLRARDVTARYGGYDQVDFGTVALGERSAAPEPVFTYGPVTRDHIRQWTGGAAYALHWRDIADLALGIEQVRYQRTVIEPNTAPVRSLETPLLYYASAGVPLTPRASAYAALTRGLEDSGLAPASAANRGQLLPPSRTGQEEAGVRYTAGGTTVVAGLFDVFKPYYNIGSDGTYTWLGTETHRGVELSLNAEPLPGLTAVAGAVFMSPQVAVASGAAGVGSAPVSQPRRILQLALDYRPAVSPRLSFDVTVTQEGQEPVRLDDGAVNPTQTIVNVGARYRFTIAGAQATLRVQVQNVTDQRVWYVYDLSGGLTPYPPLHMALAYLSADF